MPPPPKLPPKTPAAGSSVPSASTTARPMSPPPATAKPAAARQPVKTFSIGTQETGTEGEKIILYSKTGNGKTTLASMAPNPVFISFDNSTQRIINPKTGEKCNIIPGITGFQDMRDALHQKDLFPEGCTIVVDTWSKGESVAEQYIFDHYPAPGKQASRANHMRAYGWDGPAHQLDVTRLMLTDFDPHIAAGRNVILLCQQGQVTISHSAGMDYLEDGPKLQHTKQYSSRMEVCEWADHVLRIGYQDFEVTADNDKARIGKAGGSMVRAVFSGGAAHYLAKTRPLARHGMKTIPPLISFSEKTDDSLWMMLFEGAIPESV